MASKEANVQEVTKRKATDRTEVMCQRMWRQAERDLDSARMMLRPNGYYVAVNLAHQATEKALKAANWHLRGEEPPWNHHLADIAERVAERVGAIPPSVDEALVRLEPLFERSRYPSGDWEEPIPADMFGEQEAVGAIKRAEEVLEWVRELLQRPPQGK